MLVHRFTAEINLNQESIPRVLLHPVMKDEKFSDEFFTNFQSLIATKTMPSGVVHSLMTEASRLGHLTCVKACLSSGIPQEVMDKALNVASFKGHANVVAFLAFNSEVKLDRHFFLACSFGCEKVVSYMMKNKRIRGRDLILKGLSRAVKTDHSSIVRILAMEFMSVVSTDEFRKTMNGLLHEANEDGKTNTARELHGRFNL